MACGFDKERAELMLYASSLHDVGKIGISDTVLLKPGKFTAEERLIMNKHPLIGANILGNSKSALIKLARTIALYHHEKVDGTGYPHGLLGDKIPIEARIAAICDVYDALTSVRPYKEAWTNEQALTFIIDNAGSHFDAELVQNFQNIYPQILEYAQTYSDS
jgi:putative two-component system response regulator